MSSWANGQIASWTCAELINFRFCLLMERVELYLGIPKKTLEWPGYLDHQHKEKLKKAGHCLGKKSAWLIPNYMCQ